MGEQPDKYPGWKKKQKYHMWSGHAIEWLERLQQYCTIFTCYFPLTANAYDPYLYVFETDYEDFVIDLFSQLPVTCWFQKVSGVLIARMWTLRKPMEKVTTNIEDVPEL
jgi:hypothetical protein